MPARKFITDEEKQWVRISDGQIKGTTEVFCSIDFRRSNPECPSLGESTSYSDNNFPNYCKDNCIAFASGGKDPEFATSAVSTVISEFLIYLKISTKHKYVVIFQLNDRLELDLLSQEVDGELGVPNGYTIEELGD